MSKLKLLGSMFGSPKVFSKANSVRFSSHCARMWVDICGTFQVRSGSVPRCQQNVTGENGEQGREGFFVWISLFRAGLVYCKSQKKYG